MAETTQSSDAPASLDARAIARRNRDACGDTLSPVMKTAATACELAETPPPRRKVAPPGETD